ncbi:MAG: ADP-forming succinate--CoA ligase subunit beta [Actinobacteria bacterium]|nr:ADP-forming succinate--CoA ligase subunit beta [Actinomycetota bacterium]
MDLYEHQGKDLFRRYGVPTTPPGGVATTSGEAEALARDAGGPAVVKAQVLTGGRGKAGGVTLADGPDQARDAAAAMLGMDISGHTVGRVLVEPASDIDDEYYLSILTDRVSKGYKVIASVEGGVDIETVNREQPEKVVQVDLDPTVGLDRRRALDIVERAGLPPAAADQAADLLVTLQEGFVDADATLFEINPLALTTDGRVIALDAKVSIDSSALFRQPELAELADTSADDPLEARAKEHGLQYVKLDGDIGVLGNGAGRVMATLDVVSEAGGRPADFLDVGGGAAAETMAASLSLVLSDERVTSVLVNIFGGITRCDLIAEGVLDALGELGDVPQRLVVRLDGTNAEEGRRILSEAGHPNVEPAEKMLDAARRAVELAGRRSQT